MSKVNQALGEDQDGRYLTTTFAPLEALEEEPKVDEDDWDLGPACGLDPEVCESCQ